MIEQLTEKERVYGALLFALITNQITFPIEEALSMSKAQQFWIERRIKQGKAKKGPCSHTLTELTPTGFSIPYVDSNGTSSCAYRDFGFCPDCGETLLGKLPDA